MINSSQNIIGVGLSAVENVADKFLRTDNFFLGILILSIAALIQILFPPGTRTITRKAFTDNAEHLFKHGLFGFLGTTIPAKYLKEYRCPDCNKLLAKGNLKHKDDVLEVKCKGCSNIHMFTGEDADIIEKRSEYLREGLIPDPDLAK